MIGPRHIRWRWRVAFCVVLPIFPTVGGGCVAHGSRLEVVDFSEEGSPHHYAEDFDEAYYDIDPQGNLDLILRRVQRERMSGKPDVTQIVHVQSVWKSIPGQTIAHDDQINATVTYAVMVASTGHTFEGAGSVFFRSHKGTSVLTGSLGRAVVKPTRRNSPTRPLFSKAELSGRFRAMRDAQKVKTIKNDLRRVFGPHPVG